MNIGTYTGAADEDDEKGLTNAGYTHDPGQTQEENDTKDVLDAGKVDAHQCPHLTVL